MSILRQSTGDITQGSIARHLLAFYPCILLKKRVESPERSGMGPFTEIFLHGGGYEYPAAEHRRHHPREHCQTPAGVLPLYFVEKACRIS